MVMDLEFQTTTNITMINLFFSLDEMFVRLRGPSGSLLVFISWMIHLYTGECRIVCSVGLSFRQPRGWRFFHYKRQEPANVEDSLIFQTLASMNHL